MYQPGARDQDAAAGHLLLAEDVSRLLRCRLGQGLEKHYYFISTLNPKPETRNPNPLTPHPPPQTSNPKSETQNPKPTTQNLKPKTPNPKPKTTNHKPQTPNPKQVRQAVCSAYFTNAARMKGVGARPLNFTQLSTFLAAINFTREDQLE